MNLQEMLISAAEKLPPWFPYADIIRFRFSGYDLSLLLQAPPTFVGLVYGVKIRDSLLMINKEFAI